MSISRFISVKLSLGLILGILLGRWLDIAPITASMLALLLLILLGILFVYKKRPSFLFGLNAGLLIISIGVLSVTLSQPKHQKNHYTQFPSKGNRTWHIKIREVLKPSFFSNRYVASIQRMDSLMVWGKIVLNAPIAKIPTQFNVDDELLVHSSLNSIPTPLNPHQFDYASYMEHLGIYDQMLLDTFYIPLKNHTKSLYGMAATVRGSIISKLKKASFGTEEMAIIQALLLGQRTAISADTYSNYKNAGAVHILALSGLHIGILLLVLQFLLKPLAHIPHGKTIKLASIVVLLWGFAFLAGLSASIIRAVAMFTFVAYAQYLNRPTNSFNILALSLFFILLVSPNLLFQVGFQMSYAAVFAILWIYPLLLKYWTPKFYLIRKGWQLLSVSIAAQLGVLPISLFYFHQFPGLFFVSNLMIIPFLGILLILGILISILALCNALPLFLADFYNQAIHTMNSSIAWIAKQEAFIFKEISFDAVQLLGTYVLIIALVRNLSKINFKQLSFLCLSIIALQIWSIHRAHITTQKQALIVTHTIGNTVLLHQKGSLLGVASNAPPYQKMIADYKIAEGIASVQYDSLAQAYRLADSRILILDSLSIYPSATTSFDYLLLTQSSKINLNRLIDSLQPKVIIADGSNYNSTIRRWKATCTKRKLPFHYTGEKGAYYFRIKD